MGDVQLLPERAPIERRSVGLVPDSKVLWDVLAAIDEQGLDRSGVEVVVREQVVTLRGAATPKQRDAFERAAASAPSVAAVRNEIEVRP